MTLWKMKTHRNVSKTAHTKQEQTVMFVTTVLRAAELLRCVRGFHSYILIVNTMYYILIVIVYFLFVVSIQDFNVIC